MLATAHGRPAGSPHLMRRCARWAMPLAAVASLGACAVVPAGQVGNAYPSYPDPGGWSASSQAANATVVAIDAAAASRGASHTGAVMGGLIGAVIGREAARRTSVPTAERNVGTVLGAVLGAVVGSQMDRPQRDAAVRVTLNLDQGGTISLQQTGATDLRIGERVRLDGDRLQRLPQLSPSGAMPLQSPSS